MVPYGHSHSMMFMPFFGVFAILGSLLIVIPYWFIFKKAGFSPYLSLLMLVPLLNFFMMYFLAFAQWKVVPASSVYQAPEPGSYPPRI
jgi:membrane-bound ClpP family serine protease